MPSTVSCRSLWGILIYLFLLLQILMAQPDYALSGRCHPGTKHIPEVSLRSHPLIVVSPATYFQVCRTAAFL